MSCRRCGDCEPCAGGGLIKFSGIVSVQSEPLGLISYLADGGFSLGVGQVPLINPIDYVMPVRRTFENLAVDVTASTPGPFVSPVTFEFLVDGVAVLTAIATEPGPAPFVQGIVEVNAGQTVTLRVLANASLDLELGATVMLGIR